MTPDLLDPRHRQALDALAAVMQSRRPVVAFTGAGISTESGIPDYRGPNGLWTTGAARPVEYSEFMSDPEARMRWWQALPERVASSQQRAPNAGHGALARLERHGVLAATITQNIDGLHLDAGASPERVIELHGNARTIRCTSCGRVYPIQKFVELAPTLEAPPSCPACGGILKSGTVAFGEPMPRRAIQAALAVAREAAVMLVVGSTLLVHPAARVPALARESGAYLAIINIGETALDDEADLRLEAPAGPALSYLAERVVGPHPPTPSPTRRGGE
ncbi:MAG TPA: Sir2 family NAD-dependent protein deacetylase [Thermomicrobiales bacterium]|nr:Sir2 family NAD-dependent protein deacetylase [Thermomicrobiales bacterium]